MFQFTPYRAYFVNYNDNIFQTSIRFSQTESMLYRAQSNSNSRTNEEIAPIDFEIGASQPEKKKLRAFVASEPILTNPLVHDSLVDDSVIPCTNQAIPDSMPTTVIPESQYYTEFKLNSSFDYTAKLDETEISNIANDTMDEFAHNKIIEEDNNVSITVVDNSKTQTIKVKYTSPEKLDKLLNDGEDKESDKIVLCVGNKGKTESDKQNQSIRIQNNFSKGKKEITKDDHEDVVITSEVVMGDQPDSDSDESISQELEQINQDISKEIPSSPIEIYKSMLKEGLTDSPKKLLSTEKNVPYKRRLMDTEENFLGSPEPSQQQSSQQKSSQPKKTPAFARKKIVKDPGPSSFVISKNVSLQNQVTRSKSNKTVREELVAPIRKSILKRKFLEKSGPLEPTTPKFGEFDFDENKSEHSWTKTTKKKRFTSGFKTKQQRLKEEREAKRQLKKDAAKNKPNKVCNL